MSNRSPSGNHAFTGVFLVGLGVIGLLDYWWPGVMFVIAAAILVSALLDGRLGQDILTILILVAIGVIGVVGQLDLGPVPVWEIVLIAIGIAFLVKTFWKRK